MRQADCAYKSRRESETADSLSANPDRPEPCLQPLPPPPPLLLPVDRPEHGLAQAALAHRLGARGQLEVEDLLLHLGREEEQVHELGDAGTRKAELAGHVGEVGELPALEAAAQGVRESELSGDARR
jgi:hypothetical protein